jgi:hypothetical protein
MSRQHGLRISRVLFAIAISAVGLAAVEALTSGIVPKTQALCLGRTDCTPDSPQVTCSNCVTYPNICTAQAACQYRCVEGFNPPKGSNCNPS